MGNMSIVPNNNFGSIALFSSIGSLNSRSRLCSRGLKMNLPLSVGKFPRLPTFVEIRPVELTGVSTVLTKPHMTHDPEIPYALVTKSPEFPMFDFTIELYIIFEIHLLSRWDGWLNSSLQRESLCWSLPYSVTRVSPSRVRAMEILLPTTSLLF